MKKILLAIAVVLTTSASLKLNAQALPAMYTQTNVVSGLTYPVDWDWTPDGRYFITEKGGYSNPCANTKVQVYSAAGVFIGSFCDLTDSSNCDGERGLLGIAVDPNFATNHYVYTYYVHKNVAGTVNEIRVLRWTENANVGTNSMVILRLNLNTLGFAIQPYHYSGIIRFRPSQPDKLYIEVGEMYHNQQDTVAGHNFGQMLTVPYGKILRINTDGTIPTDNPFYDDGNVLTGNDDRIWSFGHRNMFGMCVNPNTDSLYNSENGLSTWDEFNIIHKGANYGWNHCEGNFRNSSTTVACNHPNYTAPLTTWGSPLPAVTGCLYYTGSVMPEFDNHILVADNDYGRIYNLTMGNPPAYDVVTNKVTFADVVPTSASYTGLTTMREGTDGCIYAMIGGYASPGSIFKICHTGVGIALNTQNENSITQNYPNPATGKTQIDFTLGQTSAVTIDLFDVTGRKVKTIYDAATVTSGIHTVEVADLSTFNAGSYFYKMSVKQNNKVIYTETKRMLLVH